MLYDKYAAQTAVTGDALRLPSTLVHGAVASVAEAGTTLWNSLTPAKMEVSTEDLLSRVDKSALQVYNEHPDAVHFASFFVGASAPIGLALKGMNLLRAGSKSVNWFSVAGKEKLLADVQAAFESGVGNTERVRQAQRALYTASALNVLTDNVAAQAAITFAMSAHPDMEDYYKDLGTNFLKNAAIGGALGGIAGRIISKGEITKIKMGVEQETVSVLNSITHTPDLTAHLGIQMQQRMQNADNIQAIIDVATQDKPLVDLSAFTIGHLKNIKLREEASAVRAFQEASTEEVATVDSSTQGSIRKLLEDPKFAGFDSVKFLSVQDAPQIEFPSTKTSLTKVWNFVSTKITQLKSGVTKTATVANNGVYSPVWERFFNEAAAPNYATLADLGKSITQLEAAADKRIGIIVRPDAGIQHNIDHTAKVQADFASAVLQMESKTIGDLTTKPLAIAPNDLASMKAVYLRLTQLEEAGMDISKVKIPLTTEPPTYGMQQIQHIARAGFSPSYLQEIAAIDAARAQYQIFDAHSGTLVPGVSESTRRLLGNWVSGDTKTLRQAALHMNNPSSGISHSAKAVEALKEIKNFPASVLFREAMAKLADADGNVLMYRGMYTAPTGHRALESYTLSFAKATEFALDRETGLRMYKVHVDDIIGVIEDIGTIGTSNMEVLVARSAPRANVAVRSAEELPSQFFSSEGELLLPKVVTPNVTTISANQLPEAIVASTLERIKELQADKYGFETIALRTGTPIEAIIDIITSGNKNPNINSLISFRDRATIEAALAPTNKALVLGANLNKIPSPTMRSFLNASTYKSLDQQIVEYELRTSPSDFVRHIGETLLGEEAKIQLQQIEKSVNDLLGYGVGTTLLRSANSVLEKLGPVGEFITGYGKQLVTLKNQAKESFTAPLSQALSGIAESDAHILELSQAINFQAALTGTRIYKNGQFWKYKSSKESILTLLRMEESDFLAHANSTTKKGNKMLEAITKADGSEFRVQSKQVDAVLKQIQSAGRELYFLKNALHKALGKGELSDLGFWVPANNPTGKQVAYAFDRLTGNTTLLLARTPSELNSFIERYKLSLGDKLKTTEIITKAQQSDFNLIAGRHDPMYMAVADAALYHGGASALAEVATTPAYLADIVQGYDHYINRGIDDLVRLQLNSIMNKLDTMSVINKVGYSPAALSKVQRGAAKEQDPGQVIKNILMGRPNLSEHEGWAGFQSDFQMISDKALGYLSNLVAPILGKHARTEADWLNVQKELKHTGAIKMFLTNENDAVAIARDVGSLQKAYLEQAVQATSSLTPRAVALLNTTAATAVLRFGEVAQALVNVLALPILTSGAVNRILAPSYGGAALNPGARFFTLSSMMDGIALMFSKHGERWAKYAEEKALFKDDWRTVNGIFKDITSLEPGVMSKAEQALDSHLVNFFSTPADKAEQLVRKVAFFTAVGIAKRAYPTLGDGGVITFARTFMDEAIGNYTAAQRPAIFQGTVGAAIGLFQTYTQTMAQTLYRQIGIKDWKALASMMTMQQSIFGLSSLPGFHPVSELIGAKYSDDNYDLTSSTFRAFGNPLAEVLLYGIPSQLAGLTTRGDIQPRLPLSEGLSSVAPAVNILWQAMAAGNRLVQAAFTADENAGRAMLEALSLQSVSRPIARFAELAVGHSMTSTGKVVSTADEIYTVPGVISRILAARPVEEIKLREAMHLDSLYGSIDADKRKKIAYRLKSHIINGDLNSDVLENLAYEYMRTGSPTGWRAAVNEALGQAQVTGAANIREHLSKNSALMSMMDDLDGSF